MKKGDKVRIISSDNGSHNCPGDIGLIREVDIIKGSNVFRVHVKKRQNIANWHAEHELELLTFKSE